MAMGKREDQQKQEPLWIAHTELAAAPGHPPGTLAFVRV
jgi:hypothetical protein